jgi:hypothetical protein
MLAYERNIIKNNIALNENMDKKELLKGSKKLWVFENITTRSIDLIFNTIYEYG